MTPGHQYARSPERNFTIEPLPSAKPSVLRKKRSEIVSTHDREIRVLVKRSRGTQRRLPVLQGRLRAWPSRASSCLLELVVYRFMYLQVSTQTCIACHNCDCCQVYLTLRLSLELTSSNGSEKYVNRRSDDSTILFLESLRIFMAS